MNAIDDLLDEIYRLQCLVYAHRRPDATPVSEILDATNAPPDALHRVVRQLASEGLIEPISNSEHPLPLEVRITERGHERVQRWNATMH